VFVHSVKKNKNQYKPKTKKMNLEEATTMIENAMSNDCEVSIEISKDNNGNILTRYFINANGQQTDSFKWATEELISRLQEMKGVSNE
jgi:hypothetical protein